jgi:hypothetical protein
VPKKRSFDRQVLEPPASIIDCVSARAVWLGHPGGDSARVFWPGHAGYRVPVHVHRAGILHKAGWPGWATNIVAALVWWPALAVMWCAVVPGSGVAAVAGIGLGLTVLGLVDTLTQASGQRRCAATRARPPCQPELRHLHPEN